MTGQLSLCPNSDAIRRDLTAPTPNAQFTQPGPHTTHQTTPQHTLTPHLNHVQCALPCTRRRATPPERRHQKTHTPRRLRPAHCIRQLHLVAGPPWPGQQQHQATTWALTLAPRAPEQLSLTVGARDTTRRTHTDALARRSQLTTNTASTPFLYR